MEIGYLGEMKKIIQGCFWLVVWGIFYAGVPTKPNQPSGSLQVIYFLSPYCTICQFYTLELRKIYNEYAGKPITFKGVFSSESITQETIESFKTKYLIPFEIVGDTTLHEQLNATVTPEVFLLNASGEILYSGRIDDSFAAIGKRRARAKHHELRDALDACLNGDTVIVKRTTPVGCIIQK